MMKFNFTDRIKESKTQVKHISAGGFMFYKEKSGNLFVALLKRDNHMYYMPKGHLKHRENPKSAAIREITEELTLQKNPNIIAKMGIDSYSFFLENDPRIHFKDVHIYIFDAETKVKINPLLSENYIDAQWLTIPEALKNISNIDAKNLIDAEKIYLKLTNKSTVKDDDYYQKIKKLNIKHYSDEVPFYSKASLREVEISLLRKLEKGCTLLDLGCGSGRFSIGAGKLGFQVTGVDITSDAIKAAKRRAKKLKLANVHFEVGDMTDLRFKDKSFDYVICPRFSINAVSTKERRRMAINEMLRVVKDDGSVFIESFNRFYLGQGPTIPIYRFIRDNVRSFRIFVSKIIGTRYSGLMPGDFLYTANKVKGAAEGYAHLPSYWGVVRMIPNGVNFKFSSIYEMTGKVKFDVLKLFRYSLWFRLEK